MTSLILGAIGVNWLLVVDQFFFLILQSSHFVPPIYLLFCYSSALEYKFPRAKTFGHETIFFSCFSHHRLHQQLHTNLHFFSCIFLFWTHRNNLALLGYVNTIYTWSRRNYMDERESDKDREVGCPDIGERI